MAKKRDHKAEYAAAKARAKRAGYKSQREYKAARKEAHIPKGARASPLHAKTKAKMYPQGMPPDPAMVYKRAASKAWSDQHSHTIRTRYFDHWPDDKVNQYYATWVVPPPGDSRRKRKRAKSEMMQAWLVPQWLNEEEWYSIYA